MLGGVRSGPARAKHMPHGAIRWRVESDKQGYEDIAPISRPARGALERYLRTHPRGGDVWMFRKRFHAYRRLFASERNHLPDVDLMRAGGWRDLATMKRSYRPHPRGQTATPQLLS